MVLIANTSLLLMELFNYFPSVLVDLFTFFYYFSFAQFSVSGQTAYKKPHIRNEGMLQFIGQNQAELLSEELKEAYMESVCILLGSFGSHWSLTLIILSTNSFHLLSPFPMAILLTTPWCNDFIALFFSIKIYWHNK